MRAVPYLILLAILSFSVITKGQNDEGHNLSDISIPESVKQEIVRRILIFKFKPSKRQKLIYLAQKGISQDWLPVIRNIEFRFLSDEETQDIATGFYFFTGSDLKNKTYDIGLGFGDPDCDYAGDGWSFRVTKNRLRLWYVGQFGGGCGGGGGEFKTPGRLNTYPNELKGYKFFDKDKLQGLKLTISTRDDVKNKFGTDCNSGCDYDQNWRIHFNYFNDFYREMTIDGKRIKIVPKEQYNDKIYSITLIPKAEILFDKIIFPRQFREGNSYTAAHDGMGGGANSSYTLYTDRYALTYNILESLWTTEKNVKWRKGQLYSIEYKIPEKLEDQMFLKQE